VRAPKGEQGRWQAIVGCLLEQRVADGDADGVDQVRVRRRSVGPEFQQQADVGRTMLIQRLDRRSTDERVAIGEPCADRRQVELAVV
jgi:hypothetical protein